MPFYLLVSANRSCVRISVHNGLKINMLYVVILFNFF